MYGEMCHVVCVRDCCSEYHPNRGQMHPSKKKRGARSSSLEGKDILSKHTEGMPCLYEGFALIYEG